LLTMFLSKNSLICNPQFSIFNISRIQLNTLIVQLRDNNNIKKSATLRYFDTLIDAWFYFMEKVVFIQK
jgi:hypothetical protein